MIASLIDRGYFPRNRGTALYVYVCVCRYLCMYVFRIYIYIITVKPYYPFILTSTLTLCSTLDLLNPLLLHYILNPFSIYDTYLLNPLSSHCPERAGERRTGTGGRGGTYMHIHIYTYIHMHIYMHIYIHMLIHIHIYVYTCIHIYTYIHIYINTYIHLHIHKSIHQYTHI
jgi:hypothetical protein